MILVTNNFTGAQVEAHEEEAAKAAFSTFRDSNVEKMLSGIPVMPMVVLVYKDWHVAYSFLSKKLGAAALAADDAFNHAISGQSGVEYEFTSFYAATGQRRSVSFLCRFGTVIYGIKVMGGAVTDWYRKDYPMPDGSVLMWAALNLETGEPIEKYYDDAESPSGARMVKISAATGSYMSDTNFIRGPEELPDDIKAMVADMPDLAGIFSWARKDYGEVVEIREHANRNPSLLALNHEGVARFNKVRAQLEIDVRRRAGLLISVADDGSGAKKSVDSSKW